MYFCILITCPILAMSICPGLYRGTPPTGQALIPDLDQYKEALSNLDIDGVMQDIEELLTDSQDCWPADEMGNIKSYGPLFIRLAWHCSGTYRCTDNKGGCAGGRQRFYPEASWEDNANLDKARALLAPIKDKYGIGLSWGDLFIFAGTTSINVMGGPISKICTGRIDETDGTKSLPLDPIASPDAPPCEKQGDCEPPIGASSTGLIYVNPEGFMGIPDPERSAQQIRDIFNRMGMNDRETVALIGGGHAFGKSHGACPDGICGTGKGKDTLTSGIEGEWTHYPLRWDNEFFELLYFEGEKYELVKGPGNKYQWMNKDNGLMMLTTDLALIYDDKYYEIVEDFAINMDALNEAFDRAWNKLTANGQGWVDEPRCVDIESRSKSSHYQKH